MARNYQGTSARQQHSCPDEGHLWAYFGAGSAVAMAGPAGVKEKNPTGQVIMVCVFCKRERYVKDCAPIFPERPESRGTHSVHDLELVLAREHPDSLVDSDGR